MELHEIRANLARCLAALDQHLAGHAAASAAPGSVDPNIYRVRPGGPLSALGEAEIERRFAAGESDSSIAIAMRISLDGVARRRAMWRRSQPTPSTAHTHSPPYSWRLWEPNGPLSELGVAEIERRFAAGEDNGTIAREMRIAPEGVAARRAMWSGSRPTPPTANAPNDPWRTRPGGPLSELGVAEIERRFAAGEDNGTIAREMRIAPEGVAARRAMWSGASR